MVVTKIDLQTIVRSFPNNISYAFGYGSGVFSQEQEQSRINDLQPPPFKEDRATTPNSDLDGEEQDEEDGSTASSSGTMIDVILSTKCTKSWHSDNLIRNPMHYSSLSRVLGPKFIEIVQNWGAGVYFNPMVQIRGAEDRRKRHLVKYGVISEKRLKNDLRHWDSIYIAGRLQKPTFTLCSCDEILQLQEEYNLRYALSAALLILPQSKCKDDDKHVGIEDVFESIAGLSYLGDPRVSAGAEDPNKIKKLVHATGQLDRFYSLYKGQFQKLEEIGLLSLTDDSVQINLMEASTRNTLYKLLPSNLQYETRSLIYEQHNQLLHMNIHDSQQHIGKSRRKMMESISKIVAPSARIQSAKGLLTAGLSKSVKYATAKLAKGSLQRFIK